MKIVKLLLISIMVFALTSCKGNDDHLYNRDQMILTKLIYNSVISEDAALEEVDLPVEEFSNEFVYDEIRIVSSSYFTTTFDYQIDPYFTENMVGEEVEIIVSILELHSPIWENWYTQEIMIIKYGDELTGFMAPYISLIDSMNEENYLPYQGKFVFQSSMFMTDTAVVKYYETNDKLYTYTIDLSDKNDISINTVVEVAGDTLNESEQFQSIGTNYSPLASDITLDLINKAMVEKVYFEAKVTSIDLEKAMIYCSSEEVTSIESISLFYDAKIYNSEGNLITLDNLKEHDVITGYYFNRYENYNPIDITVTEITLN